MQTVSVMLQTLCVPCACHCRYCLLNWDGTPCGADYGRSERVARRFYDWLRLYRPEISFNFAFGYAMEHPDLPRALTFLRSIDSVSARFLQMDGMRMRNDDELKALAALLAEQGVEHLNFTFYGLPEAHDRFAGRRGDFDLLRRTAVAAHRQGLQVSAGLPLTQENAAQADALLSLLTDCGIDQVSCFIPHGEGRGRTLEPIRFTQADFERLPAAVRERINPAVFCSEGEQLRRGFPPEERRMILLSLTPENIGRFESETPDALIAEVEALDEAWYAAFPAPEELARRYGDLQGGKWYSRRDLLYRYRQLYLRDHPAPLYDVTDERQSGSRRF